MPGLGIALSPVGHLCNLVLTTARYWVRRHNTCLECRKKYIEDQKISKIGFKLCQPYDQNGSSPKGDLPKLDVPGRGRHLVRWMLACRSKIVCLKHKASRFPAPTPKTTHFIPFEESYLHQTKAKFPAKLGPSKGSRTEHVTSGPGMAAQSFQNSFINESNQTETGKDHHPTSRF